MQIAIEVSNPHYHPGQSFDMKVTKKRDLSVPPNWVANERIEKDGVSYAIVMPPREKELFEDRQTPHLHLPSKVMGRINGQPVLLSIKISNADFTPVIHFDHIDAERYGIKKGTVAIL